MNYRNGSIGGGILTRLKVTFDYFNQQIYVKKAPGFKRSFKHNMSGLVVKATGAKLKEFTVADVRAGSPAGEAGIEEDDKILSINGNSFVDLSLGYINDLFTSREYRKVNMTLLRKGERLTKTFRLRKDI